MFWLNEAGLDEKKSVAILGSRGIPAKHGGFETFAEHLALYLVSRNWQVSVYCQEEGRGPVWEDEWQRVHLVHIPVNLSDAIGTIIFDLKSTFHASRSSKTILTLGYNTAIFSLLYRLKRLPSIFNMDGLEWQRAKWSLPAKTWLWVNERACCLLSDHLIADHPEINKHLATRCLTEKITMIPYGSDAIFEADIELLEQFNLDPGNYALAVARPEPENSLLEIVSAFSARPRGFKLVVLGHYQPEQNAYHRHIMDAAGSEVFFAGAVYNQDVVASLRFYCRLYLHGHQVGGTNPSLVEALGAGSPVLAHDNRFNRWVAGSEMAYFGNTRQCAALLDELLDDSAVLKQMSTAARLRHAEEFTWDKVLAEYESLLEKMNSNTRNN